MHGQVLKGLATRFCVLLLVVLGLSGRCWAQGSPTSQPPSCGPFWAVFAIISVLLFLFLVVTFIGLLRSKEWSLADAVSEEAGNQPSELPAGQKPVMVASTSRLVALLGLLAILSVFIGVGYYVLWSLFCKGTVPPLGEIMKFFYSGAAMFAPYLVNQLKEAFSSFAPKS